MIYHIGVAEVQKLVEDGTVAGGMIPKVRGCIDAIEHGVNRTHILNGTIPIPSCWKSSRIPESAPW